MSIVDSFLTYVIFIPSSIVNHVHVLRPELYKYHQVGLSNPHQTLLPLPPNLVSIPTSQFRFNMSSDPRFVIVTLTSVPRPTILADSYFSFVGSKTSGNVKNTVGKAEETVGNMTGLESLQTSGKKRQAEGDVELKQAQAQGYVEGTMDRVSGAVEDVKGSLTGDSSQEVSGWCFGFLYLLAAADNFGLFREGSQREGQGAAGCKQAVIPSQIL